jgi:predicted DNA-binding transcriptional regulator YafY
VEVSIVYFSKTRGRLGRRILRPHGLFEREGHYYVVGWCDPPGRVITLRVDRIREVEEGAEEYEIPDDFEVSTYRMDSLPEPEGPAHRVRVRFDPDVARFARELFPAQDLEEAEDGAIVATVRTNGVYWLVSEILRWGRGAEVLSPPEFREEVVSRARSALERYGRKG